MYVCESCIVWKEEEKERSKRVEGGCLKSFFERREERKLHSQCSLVGERRGDAATLSCRSFGEHLYVRRRFMEKENGTMGSCVCWMICKACSSAGGYILCLISLYRGTKGRG